MAAVANCRIKFRDVLWYCSVGERSELVVKRGASHARLLPLVQCRNDLPCNVPKEDILEVQLYEERHIFWNLVHIPLQNVFAIC